MLDVSEEIIEKAVEIRQQKRIKLGDSIIAATALVHQLEISTRNTKDFIDFPGLKVDNPLE